MVFRDELAAVARDEWEWFGRDTGEGVHRASYTNDRGQRVTVNKEEAPTFAARVGDYWLSINERDYTRLVKAYAPKLGKLDGTVTRLPWSAAFISYCFQMSGAGDKFPYSPGHATWIKSSIKNKMENKLKASLVGYRISEQPVRVGDVLAKARNGSGVTYDNVLNKDWFDSHSDIVVEVKPGKAVVIGGNVGQSVSMRDVAIDDDGHVLDDRWIVVIQNNISLPVVGVVRSQMLVNAG